MWSQNGGSWLMLRQKVWEKFSWKNDVSEFLFVGALPVRSQHLRFLSEIPAGKTSVLQLNDCESHVFLFLAFSLLSPWIHGWLMIWIYNSAFVILWSNVEVIWPERIIFCPRRGESCMDLLDFQRHCPAIVGCSSAVQMASRPTAMHRDSQIFRWKAPVPGILRGWNCTTNLRGPWTLMTMLVLVLQQSFKDWVFFSWCVTPGFLQAFKNSEVLRFALAKPPEAKHFAAELCDSAMLTLNPPEVPSASTCSISSVTDGRAVTKPGLVISLILSSKGNLLEWPDISGFKYDLKGQVHGRVARIAASQIQTLVEAFGWKVISVFVAWRCPRRRIILMEF